MSRTRKHLVCVFLIALIVLTGAVAALANSGWIYDGQWTGVNVLGNGTHVVTVQGYGFTWNSQGTFYLHLYDTAGTWHWNSDVYKTGWVDANGWTRTLTRNPDRDFPNGDKICATWVGTNGPTGNACATIHS